MQIDGPFHCFILNSRTVCRRKGVPHPTKGHNINLWEQIADILCFQNLDGLKYPHNNSE
jgi:hypothetical protein